MHRTKLFACLLIYTLAIAPARADPLPVAIVVKDRVPLLAGPGGQHPVAHRAAASLQLSLTGASTDGAWLEVKIGENKGLQFDHGQRFWVAPGDVFRPKSTPVKLDLDVSLLAEPAGRFDHRLSDRDYAYAESLPASFYVSSLDRERRHPGRPGCAAPFSRCGSLYHPGRLPILELAEHPPSAVARYRRLAEQTHVSVVYRLRTRTAVASIRERLVLARVIMEDASCYPRGYLRTEVVTLAEESHRVGGTTFSRSHPVATARLLATEGDGEIQYVNLMIVLDLKYRDGSTETLAERAQLSVAFCL